MEIELIERKVLSGLSDEDILSYYMDGWMILPETQGEFDELTTFISKHLPDVTEDDEPEAEEKS